MNKFLYFFLFSFCFVFFYLGFTLKNIENLKTCNFVQEAEVLLEGEKLTIPAIKGTTITFSYNPFDPKRVQSVGTYNDVPWTEKQKDFVKRIF